MGPSGKWIDGIAPEASVVDAARTSLAARLTAVAHWLPLAAYHAEQDVEHVHRLRVSTRRAMAALRLYRDWLPNKKRRWIKKQLKKIRRAAGDARDVDVLAGRVREELAEKAAPVVSEVKELRASAQPAILDVAEKCRREDRFVRNFGKLLDGIRPPHDSATPLSGFRDWAHYQLAHTADEFFKAVPANGADTMALHQFRIQTKALRYAIELAAPAFGPELREMTYPMVEELQERLGAIQDCVAGAAHLRKWSSDTHDAEVCKLLDELARRQDERLSNLLAEFHQWWTPERIATLKSNLLFADRSCDACAPPAESNHSPESQAAPLEGLPVEPLPAP